MKRVFVTALALFGLFPGMMRAASYNESVDGDLSDIRTVPTFLPLAIGENDVRGTIILGDLDYLTIRVPAGGQLSRIELLDYQSSNARAFMGLQAGNTFSFDPPNADPALLLGYVHFGIDNQIGDDLLGPMATSFGSIGFGSTLMAGDYTFWVNQTEPSPVSFGFRLIVVPEPAASTALCILAFALRRRRFMNIGSA